jgi:hypothetical protein
LYLEENNLMNATTITGQKIIKFIAKLIEDKGLRIVSGVTDSIMVHVNTSTLDKAIDLGNKMKKYIIENTQKMIKEEFKTNKSDLFDIKFEDVSKGIHFSKSKYYHKILWDGDYCEKDKFIGLDFPSQFSKIVFLEKFNNIEIDYKEKFNKLLIDEIGQDFSGGMTEKYIDYYNKYLYKNGMKKFNNNNGKLYYVKKCPSNLPYINCIALPHDEKHFFMNNKLIGFELDYDFIYDLFVNKFLYLFDNN